MSSKPPEPEIPRLKLEEIHAAGRSPGEKDQPAKDLRPKRFGPECVSPRYELRTSNRNEIQQNVSAKRGVERPLPGEPSTKRRRTPPSTLNVSGTPEKSLRQRRQQIGGSSSEVSFQEVKIKEAEFYRVINRRIQVYWNLDEAWYTGLVKRYDPTNKLHHVVYDDGEEEWVSLERDKVKIQIVVPGEFSTIPNRGIGQNKRDDLEDRNAEHGKHGGIDSLQQVGTDCLQKSGIDSSQKKNKRRKVLTEEQKGGIDAAENTRKKTTRKNLLKEEQEGVVGASEERNAKRGKRCYGIDGNGIECTGSLLDLTEKVNTSNEDSQRPITNVFDHSSSGADSEAVGLREASFYQRRKPIVSVYSRRSRPSSSLNVDNSENVRCDVSNRPGAEGGVVGSSRPASRSGAEETCTSRRGDDHADIEDSAFGDRTDMELEKTPADAEFQIESQNLKSNVESASRVGEICMGSVGDENAALGSSELANCGNTELEKAPVGAEFQNCPQKLKSNIDNASGVEETCASGVEETCMGRSGNEHFSIGALPSVDMELEKAPADTEYQIVSQNLKSNVDSASGVGETCIDSRRNEHAATGSSELANCSNTELEKALVNAEFQNCPQKLETCIGGRGNGHSAVGALASVVHSDMELEKAPMNSELQNCPQNLESNIGYSCVSTFSSTSDDCTRSKAGQKGALETSTYAANKEHRTYVRKRRRKPANAECNEVPAKRFRKLNLEETAVSPNAKGKEIIAVPMMVSRGIHGEKEYENSRSSRYDKIPSYRFDKALSKFGDDTSGSTKMKLVPESNFRFPERWNVSTAPKVHMSDLYLREPSYWQCVASGLQLYKMGPVNINRSHSANVECAKLLSRENLMLFLGSMFRFLNAGFELSSSSCNPQMALQQFEIGGHLNSRNYADLPLWECFQSLTTRSHVQVELLVFDTMSNTHKLCFWGPFSEVLFNFSMSLASLMSSTENRFPAEMFGAVRPVNINVPIQSITVKLSSLQSGAWSPFICNFENLHNMASANWNECKKKLTGPISSFRNLIEGESRKSNIGNLHCYSHHMGYSGKDLVRAGALCECKQGAEVVNVFRSVENQHFTSSLFQRFNGQFVSLVFANHSKKSLGRIVQCHQPVPSIRMTFVDSPSFFQYLHLKPLFGKVIHPDCYGLLPSEEVPNKTTRKRRLSIRMHELVSDDGDLKTDKCSAVKRVTLKVNSSPTLNDMIAPSSALSLGFDANVTGTSSEMLSRQNNLAPVSSFLKFPIFPVLKFQRRSTDHRSWHLSGISVPSLYKGRTSGLAARVDFLQSHRTELDLNKGHFVKDNQREYNMLHNGTAYAGRMESSQSGYSHSISDNADESMPKSEKPARRGRPSRQQKKEKYKDVDVDSQTCATNILNFGGGQSWRERGAEVALEALSLNEWVLNVKLDGLTRFRYKAQEPKIPRAREQKLPKAGEQTLGNPKFHTIIWTSGQDWNLEFTERKQWSLFRKMYEICYSRNLRAASIKNIPIPTVREINVDDLSAVRIPFERPINYIQGVDEVSRALDGDRFVYDMDSDDEEWLCRFNSADADYGIGVNKVSEDAFEGVIYMLEKAAFMQECDFLTVDEVLQLCSELAPVKVLTSIHAHWLGKRKKKGTTLIPEFQTSPSNSIKHAGKSYRGKALRTQRIGKPSIRQPHVRSCEVGTSTEMQQQFYGISSGSEGSSDAVDPNLEKVLEGVRAARAAKENAAIKRKRAQRLFQVADLATYKAVVASRNAEQIREIEQARLLGSQTSAQFPSDSRIIKNVNGSGGSMNSLSVQ